MTASHAILAHGILKVCTIRVILVLFKRLVVSKHFHKVEDSVEKVSVGVVNLGGYHFVHESFKTEMSVNFSKSFQPQCFRSLALGASVMTVNPLALL